MGLTFFILLIHFGHYYLPADVLMLLCYVCGMVDR